MQNSHNCYASILSTSVFFLGLLLSVSCDSESSGGSSDGGMDGATDNGAAGNGGMNGGAGDDQGAGASTLSTSPTIQIAEEAESIEAGQQSTVTVELRNIPISSYHLLGSDTEYFALVAVSSDGGEVTMQNAFGSSNTELRIDWASTDLAAHPIDDPADFCTEDLSGIVVDTADCEDVCCMDSGSPVRQSRGSCGSIGQIDACVAPYLLDNLLDCCVEYRPDIICCSTGVFTTPELCEADQGSEDNSVCEADEATFVNSDPAFIESTTLGCPDVTDAVQNLWSADRCTCCVSEAGELPALSFTDFCEGEQYPFAACVDGGCAPDYSDGNGYCRTACCALPDGNHEVMDLKHCIDAGGTDAGLGSPECQLADVCCRQGDDFSRVSRLQYASARATIDVTGVTDGTVLFLLKQVTVDTAPLAFIEEFNGSSSADLAIGSGEAVLECANVEGVWEFSVTGVDSSCGPEPDWTMTVSITQAGCGVDALETTGIKDTAETLPGTIQGDMITIGPFDFDDDGGVTKSSLNLTVTSETTMTGSETFSWSDPEGDECLGGSSMLTGVRN